MFRPFLATGLGVIATTLGFWGTRVQTLGEEHLDIWGAAKRLMRIAGPMTVLVGILWAIHAAGGRLNRPEPIVVRHTVALPEFGVQVTLPPTWTVGHGKEGTNFVARDSVTGAVLSGEIVTTDPNKSLAADIDRIVEQQRARLGPEHRSSRGVIALGLLNAQFAELSYEPLGNPMRIRTIALRRGNRVLALTCDGGDPAQTACSDAIKPEH